MNPATAPTAQRSFVWPALIAVIVVAGVLAVLAARGSGGDDTVAADGPQTSQVTISGTALAPLPDGPEDPAIGTQIPAVSGKDFDGSAVSIGPDDGAQILVFLAHWCPNCQAEVPRIVDHLADNPMPDDVGLTFVSTSVRTDGDEYPPEAWLDSEGWEGTTLVDSEASEAASAFGLTAFPYFVAVDADGNVAARASGQISTEQFDALVSGLQGGS